MKLRALANLCLVVLVSARALPVRAESTARAADKRLAPALIRERASDDAAVQRRARERLAKLGLNTPQRLYGDPSDPELLVSVLEAAGAVRADDALPWLVAYLDHPLAIVRTAARAATAKFGSQAAEPLRVRLSELERSAPDPDWTAKELLAHIVDHVEANRELAAREPLAQAERLLAKQSELDTARTLLDRALSHGVMATDARRLARAYLALGAQYDRRDDAANALIAFRRALRSDPNGSHAAQAQARILYLEAEQRLAGGVVDTHALRRAVALDPQHPAARSLLTELERVRDREAFELRKRIGLAGALLLTLAGVLTLWTRRARAVAS